MSRTTNNGVEHIFAGKRITVPCFPNPLANPHLVESGIRNLVLRLHGLASIQCLASCHGHGWFRGLRREPYLYFHARPEIAEWFAAVIEVLPLARMWQVKGTIHSDLGLCFSLEPWEQSPLFAGHSQDWRDLEILARILPEYVQFPQQNQHTYHEKQKAANELTPAFVERVGICALRAANSNPDRHTQRFAAFFARFQRHRISSGGTQSSNNVSD